MAIGVTEQMGPQWCGKEYELHCNKSVCGSVAECKLKLFYTVIRTRRRQRLCVPLLYNHLEISPFSAEALCAPRAIWVC